MAKSGKSSKAGKHSNKPSAKRYKAEGRLEKRKIRNLVRYCKMTEAKAFNVWHRSAA